MAHYMIIYPVGSSDDDKLPENGIARRILIKKFDEGEQEIDTSEADAESRLVAILASDRFAGFKGLEWAGHIE